MNFLSARRNDGAGGNQLLLSSGGNFVSPIGVDVASDGFVYVSDGGQLIIRVDPAIPDDGSGSNQTVISSAGNLTTPGGIVAVPEPDVGTLQSAVVALWVLARLRQRSRAGAPQ